MQPDGTQGPWLSYDELVAQCMKEQGFEYWPGLDEEPDELVDPSREDQIEARQRDGYGIVPAYSELNLTIGGPSVVDANQSYVSTLSQSMAEAYNEALYGSIWEELADPETGLDTDLDWRSGGCDGAALHELGNWGDAAIVDPAGTPYDDLISQMLALRDQVPAQPQWQVVTTRWSSCMAAQGMAFESWDDAYSAIQDELNEMMARVVPERISNDDFIAIVEGSSGLPGKEELEDLRSKERDIAVADLECQFEADRDTHEAEVLRVLEAEFLEDNRERLDEMKAWFEAQG